MGLPTHQKKTKTHSTGRVFLTKKNLRQKTKQKYEQPTFSFKYSLEPKWKTHPSKASKSFQTGFWESIRGGSKKPKNYGSQKMLRFFFKQRIWRSEARGCCQSPWKKWHVYWFFISKYYHLYVYVSWILRGYEMVIFFLKSYLRHRGSFRGGHQPYRRRLGICPWQRKSFQKRLRLCQRKPPNSWSKLIRNAVVFLHFNQNFWKFCSPSPYSKFLVKVLWRRYGGMMWYGEPALHRGCHSPRIPVVLR